MSDRRRWTLVFTGEKFCTRAKLREAMDLETARKLGGQDPVCKTLGGYMDFKGILGVDITNQDLWRMGYHL